MNVQVFASNADLPDHLRWQIISLIRIQWYKTAGDYTGPSALPDEWHPTHVVGTSGDAIVSYAGVVRRDIEHAGERFRICGLSSVYTFPARRRHGLGTRVVQRVTSIIRRSADADLAVLFTMPGLEPFYERCGWEAMPSTTFLIGSRSSPQVHGAVPMMQFVSARGRAHRPAFEHARVYFGEDAW